MQKIKNVQISKELHRTLAILAAQTGVKIGAHAEKAIAQYVEKETKKVKA